MEALNRTGRVVAIARRHRVFLVVLGAGVALRVMTQLAYRPALLYIDSFRYLSDDYFHRLNPSGLDPIGYDVILLRPVLWVGNLAAVAAVQHVIGLGMSVALYLVLTRKGVRPWVAGLATVPVLLDAYQLQIEQNVMSDTLFEALILAALIVLIWPERIGYRACIAAGSLLGIAVTVRLVGETLIVPAAVFVFIAAAGRWWVRVAMVSVTALAFAVPLLAYAAHSEDVTGSFSVTASDTGALYARAVSIVDCPSLSMPEYERVLCPKEPIGKRPVDIYAHSKRILRMIKPPKGMSAMDVQRDFSLRVFVQQPVDMIKAVLDDFAHGFALTRSSDPFEVPLFRWQFQDHYPIFTDNPVPVVRSYGGGRPRVTAPLASFLRGYQLSVGYVPGPFLAAAFLLGLLAAAGIGRARRSPLRAAGFGVATTGLVLLLTADFFEFSWRYQLPSLILAPFAGAIGMTALLGSGPRLLSPELDETDEAAIAAFRAGDGRRLGSTPIVVVIAAYQEEASIGSALDELPDTSCGLAVHSIVVVDGSTDRTAEVAAAHGALVCPVTANRGQGAALRLGYALARTGEARFIVTTDADGQYVGSQLDRLLEPLVSGEADFVTGSRWLGQQQTKDRIRRLGSRLFARLATIIMHQRITDTSFGFRAMTVEVAASVTLRQPQYQASELLVQVLARGFRVVERPMTMRTRAHGRSKKGRWIAYGWRFAQVMFGTWLRERRRARPEHVQGSATRG